MAGEQDLFEESETDFSADDDIADPTFTIEKASKRKGSLLFEVAIKERRLDSNWSSKIIFNADFYTDFVKLSSDDKETTIAKCVECGRNIRGYAGGSSNFVTHLKLKHADAYKKYKNMKLGNFGSLQECVNGKILHWIVDAAMPVFVVDRQSFVSIFEGTGLKIMSRQTAKKTLEDSYQNMLAKIKDEISSAEYFCTTADIWSGNNRGFFGYTCHWLTQDFQRQSVALACRRFKGAHTADKVGQMIAELNNFFDLDNKNIVMTITDNGSNFIKAFKDHGVDNFHQEEDDSDDELSFRESEFLLPKHHRCSSHTLNLLATTDFLKILKADLAVYEKHKMIFEKCNSPWKKCNWPKSSEVIVAYLGSNLVVPVVTRWNSLYDAVTKIIHHKSRLNILCEQLSLAPFSLSDVQYLESYKLLMTPIAQALDFLQGEQNVKFGLLLPVLITLSNKLQKLSKKEFHLSSFAAKINLALWSRFEIFLLYPLKQILQSQLLY
uniref:Putative AC9 transposase n=1 Tax=Bactrocera dorsalis TaxID=27457 RepID=A0A034WVU3_BACDO